MKTRTLFILSVLFLAGFAGGFLSGCQGINNALGITPATTATDQVYKYQATYNLLVAGVVTARQNKLIPDAAYNGVFEPARKTAWNSLGELKVKAVELDKQGKQVDPTDVAVRALEQALNQMSFIKTQYVPANPTGASDGNSGNRGGGIPVNPDDSAVGSIPPSDANPGATPSD